MIKDDMMYIFLLKTIFWISGFFVVYTYFMYPLFLLLWDRLMPRMEFKKNNGLPKVSLIVSAYNEEKVIRSRIENCLSLDYPKENLEVIIASDGSDDGTASIVKEYASKGIRLFDYKDRRGKVNVLNETVSKASYEIMAFSDANTMFKRDALKNLVRHFIDERIGCVCGGLQFVNAHDSKTGELEGFYWRYETMLKKLEGQRGSLLGANGAIYAIRKNLYEVCPEDTVVEDFYIPMKILQKGYLCVYDPQASAIEEATHKIIQEKERRIRIGAGDFQALFRLLPMLNPFKGFPALAFWSHKVLRWFAPFFLIMVFVANVFLIHEPLYSFMFGLQVVFYTMAWIGQILNWSGMHVKFFNLCYYFVSMNLALLLGFFRYVAGKQQVAWDRTER